MDVCILVTAKRPRGHCEPLARTRTAWSGLPLVAGPHSHRLFCCAVSTWYAEWFESPALVFNVSFSLSKVLSADCGVIGNLRSFLCRNSVWLAAHIRTVKSLSWLLMEHFCVDKQMQKYYKVHPPGSVFSKILSSQGDASSRLEAWSLRTSSSVGFMFCDWRKEDFNRTKL